MSIKRIINLGIIGVICICFIFGGICDTKAYADEQGILFALETYKPVGYKSSDCVLTANVYMIRRAMILEGSDKWIEVINSKLRKFACTTSTGSCMRFDYKYKKAGLTFSVVHDTLRGSKDSKFKALKKLLITHPEGVVIWGIDINGYPHGVLATHVKGKILYAVDSAQNLWGRNRGIVKLTETTVPNLNTVSNIWYIDKITGKTKVNIKKEDLYSKVNDEFENDNDSEEEIPQFEEEVKAREAVISEINTK